MQANYAFDVSMFVYSLTQLTLQKNLDKMMMCLSLGKDSLIENVLEHKTLCKGINKLPFPISIITSCKLP